MPESQKHGLILEDLIIRSHTGISKEEYDKKLLNGYTSKFDLVEGIDVDYNMSIKTSAKKNIGCGDIRRFYEETKNTSFKMLIFSWAQISPLQKEFYQAHEFFIKPEYHEHFWGDISFQELKEFDDYIKNIPHGKQGQKDNKDLWKEKRDVIKEKYPEAIMRIDAKVDSRTQRRTQCSFKIDKLKNIIPYEIYLHKYRDISLPLIIDSPPRLRKKNVNS
tara:strand:+ start:63 stop:719 length:657 start_codon:yes stop_codon:yes gene_type:complete